MNTVIAGTTLFAAAVLTTVTGFQVPWRDFTHSGIVIVSAVFTAYRMPRIAGSLMAVCQIATFSAGYLLLTYVVARFNFPLVDHHLARLDAMLGFKTLVDWHNSFLGFAYDSMILQTGIVLAVLGARSDSRHLEAFVSRFMVGGLVTLAVFAFLPAEGAFAFHGLEASSSQANYLTQLTGLRSGALASFDLSSAEGLITFPSFHTFWAIILTAALWHTRLATPFGLLNAAVVLATMTTGWHYLTDVLGGGLLATILIWRLR